MAATTSRILFFLWFPVVVYGQDLRLRISPSRRYEADVNTNVTFVCTIIGLSYEGHQQHDLRWDFSRPGRYRHEMRTWNSLIMTIKKVQTEDAGNYICLSHKLSLHTYVSLHVKMPFIGGKHIEITPSGSIIAFVGSSIEMKCSTVLRNEECFLKWVLPHLRKAFRPVTQKHYIDSSDYPVVQSLELVIHQLTKEDGGLYTCHCRNFTQSVLLGVLETQANATSGCSETQFRCQSGHCIFRQYRCDRIVDCPDASDEVGCDPVCGRRFRCDNGRCIDVKLVCDQYHSNDCRDNSDEDNCIRETYAIQDLATIASHPGQSINHHDDTMAWTMSTIYSVLGIIVGLVCLVAILVIIMFRIRLKQRVGRSLTLPLPLPATERRQPDRRQRPRWQQSTPFNLSPDVDDYIPPHRTAASTNLALNINLRMMNGTGGEPDIMIAPPPYTENPTQLPQDDTPPPPYSTLDRSVTRGNGNIRSTLRQDSCILQRLSPTRIPGLVHVAEYQREEDHQTPPATVTTVSAQPINTGANSDLYSCIIAENQTGTELSNTALTNNEQHQSRSVPVEEPVSEITNSIFSSTPNATELHHQGESDIVNHIQTDLNPPGIENTGQNNQCSDIIRECSAEAADVDQAAALHSVDNCSIPPLHQLSTRGEYSDLATLSTHTPEITENIVNMHNNDTAVQQNNANSYHQPDRVSNHNNSLGDTRSLLNSSDIPCDNHISCMDTDDTENQPLLEVAMSTAHSDHELLSMAEGQSMNMTESNDQTNLNVRPIISLENDSSENDVLLENNGPA